MKQALFGKSARAISAFAMATALFVTPTSAVQNSDSGTITVSYVPGIDEGSDELGNILRDAAIFEDLASGISDGIKLPSDMSVEFRNCDAPNAFYEPANKRIVMCYELMAMFGQNLAAANKSEDELGQNILFATTFFFYHEMGHALIHQLDIPITGKEEDAVDDMAALLLLENNEDGGGAVMIASVVEQFGELATKMEDMDSLPFWDQHSLDAQRMYHLICLIYGSNPEAYAELANEDTLPKERAANCPFEYQQRKRSWERLMENHLKPDPA